MSTNTLDTKKVETVQELISALEAFKSGDGSENYVGIITSSVDRVLVELVESRLSDGSTVRNIYLKPAT